MNKGMFFAVLLTIFTVFIYAATEDKKAYLDTSLSFERRAADLVSQMTLDEKISQTMNDAGAVERLGIPKYNWWSESLHGVANNGIATVFPQAIGMAASFDPKLMLYVATVISDEARAKHHENVRNGDRGLFKGLTFWSPNINIFRDPRWGRGQETYGEDPYLTGQMGIPFVKGLQGDDPKYLKVVSTAKHYAVHSGPEPLRHTFNAVPSKRDLYETYLPAFRDLVQKGGVYSVMGAYNRVDSESASASKMLLDDVLRGEWGFDGYVVSDCGAISDIYTNHKIADDPEQAAAIGVRRGCDLECGRTYSSLKEAVKRGYLTEQEIDICVYRLMLARMKLGMFDPAGKVKYAQIPITKNDSPENDAVAQKMARESMVLLKNDGILPLDKKKIKTIAVIGPNADNIRVLYGNYNGISSKPITILQGIRNAVGPGAKVLYTSGCEYVEGFKLRSGTPISSKFLKTPDGEPGLKGEYYNNRNLEGQPAMVRTDSSIEFEWGSRSPTTDMVNRGEWPKEKAMHEDEFSVRWTGKLTVPQTREYEFCVTQDDGCRFYIDDKLLIDDWTQHAARPIKCKIQMEQGKEYDIRLEYFEGPSDAEVTLGWDLKVPEDQNPYEQAIEFTRQADVAIFVGGLSPSLEGEEMYVTYPGFKGGDRTDISLPETQTKLLKAMYATGKPVIFVMLTGSALAVNWEQENLPAILCGWYPGQHGDAVADVLFGTYNPAGRLPVTFYKSVDQLPAFEDYSMQGKTYRYFKGEPLYPFGHGLSFTTFKYSDIKINKSKVKADDAVEVSFNLTNTGKIDGDEVAQLYVHDVESTLPMAIKQLRGFQRVSLKAGQSQKVTFKLNPKEDMSYYDVNKRDYAVEPGTFEIQIGASSADIRVKDIITVQYSILTYCAPVSTGFKPAGGILSTYTGKGICDSVDQCIFGTGLDRSKALFYFAPHLLYGIQVRRIRRQKPHLGSDRFDHGYGVRVFMSRKVVHDNDISKPQASAGECDVRMP
jgi:beta-glucosidase